MFLNFLRFLLVTFAIFAICHAAIKDELDKAEEKKGELTKLVEEMKKDPSTSSVIPGDSESVGKKITTAGKKFAKASLEAYNADEEGNAERIAGAISGAGEGLVGMVNGIKNKDWKAGVKGALQIVASIAQLAGPKGMIAAAVLSFISSLFDLFGGSAKTESMEDKMKRVVAEQIDIGREKDLKADVEGMKLTYQSISASIQHFRESKDLKVDQANQIYNLAFEALPVVGKLRARIKDVCDDLDDDEKAKTCLTAINLYCDVSILRQLVLIDMASLLADVNDYVHDPEGEKNTSVDVTGLLVVGNNLLHIVKKEQESDAIFLRFLTDPFNLPKRRYVIAMFFNCDERYASVKSYIGTLEEVMDDGMFKDYVMMCKSTKLKGECNILTLGDYREIRVDPKGWGDAIASLYIPLGLQVLGYDHPDFEGTENGPFAGPTVLTEIKDGNDWDSVKVQSTKRDADEEVRFCERENMLPRHCDTVPIGEHNLRNLHGGNWEGKTRSMYIPAGLMVHGYTNTDKSGDRFMYFIGPQIVNNVYAYARWKRIDVLVKQGMSSDATEQIWFCDGEDLGGQCRTAWRRINDLTSYTGTNFKNKIKSLKIPGGMYVTGYSDAHFGGARYGPYTGPATISKVDPPSKWGSFKVTRFGVDQDSRTSKN